MICRQLKTRIKTRPQHVIFGWRINPPASDAFKVSLGTDALI
jgi:hypothetical protein